jgi:hypothetical protein
MFASLKDPEPPPQEQDEVAEAVVAEAPAPAPRAAPRPRAVPQPEAPSVRNSTRVDKVMVATFLPKDAHKRLRQIALDEDTDVQMLVYDGLNLLFRAKNLPQIPKPPRVKRGPKAR